MKLLWQNSKKFQALVESLRQTHIELNKDRVKLNFPKLSNMDHAISAEKRRMTLNLILNAEWAVLFMVGSLS